MKNSIKLETEVRISLSDIQYTLDQDYPTASKLILKIMFDMEQENRKLFDKTLDALKSISDNGVE